MALLTISWQCFSTTKSHEWHAIKCLSNNLFVMKKRSSGPDWWNHLQVASQQYHSSFNRRDFSLKHPCWRSIIPPSTEELRKLTIWTWRELLGKMFWVIGLLTIDLIDEFSKWYLVYLASQWGYFGGGQFTIEEDTQRSNSSQMISSQYDYIITI